MPTREGHPSHHALVAVHGLHLGLTGKQHEGARQGQLPTVDSRHANMCSRWPADRQPGQGGGVLANKHFGLHSRCADEAQIDRGLVPFDRQVRALQPLGGKANLVLALAG